MKDLPALKKLGPASTPPSVRGELWSASEIAEESPAPYTGCHGSKARVAVLQQIKLISGLGELGDLLHGARAFRDLSVLGPRTHGVTFLNGKADPRSTGGRGSPKLRSFIRIRRDSSSDLEGIPSSTRVDRRSRPLAEVFGVARRLGSPPELAQQSIRHPPIRYHV